MDLGADLGRIFLPLFFLFACIFYFQRARWHVNQRRRKKRWGYYPSSASVGNAFQEMQRLAQPRMAYVLQEKRNEKEDEDDQGEPKDPTERLKREMKRIRDGRAE
jgi:hypothetical protein